MGAWSFKKSIEKTRQAQVKMKVKSLSCVRLFVIPWTVACQTPPPMGFSRQEYWSGSPFPSPGDLPDPGIEPWSPVPQADSLLSELNTSEYMINCKYHILSDYDTLFSLFISFQQLNTIIF